MLPCRLIKYKPLLLSIGKSTIYPQQSTINLLSKIYNPKPLSFKQGSNLQSTIGNLQSLDMGLEFKPGTVKIQGNRITFPRVGEMKFFGSRPITSNLLVRTVTIRREANGWYVSLLLRDDKIPDYYVKKTEQLNTVTEVAPFATVIQSKKLPGVTRKVTPKPEVTGSLRREKSLPLGDEPGNPTKSKYIQLSLFDLEEWKTG